MAVNQSRSMNAELYEGRCDGSQNKVVMHRGGQVSAVTRMARESLHPHWGYGYISEDPNQQIHGDEVLPG